MDRAVLTAFGEAHRRQTKGDLDRHVLLAAERATDRLVDDPDPILGQPENVSDLFAILRRPLATDLDRDPTFLVDVGGAGLRLKVGVFLMRNLVHLVDDGVGQGEAEVGIALADSKLVVGVGVEPVLGVDQRGPGSERGVDVVDERKVLPLDLDRGGAGGGGGARLGDHDGDLIRFPAADRSVDGGCIRVVDPHERRLVAHREAVLVHGRVGGGDDVDDAGHRTRCIGRHRQHPGVSPAREDDNGVQCSGRNGISCVFDRPVGLGGGVVAERGLADAHPNTLSSSSTGTTLARRTACMIG